ncbi:DUF5722 domain-containing protein [Parapedobacter sp. 10938]|uniref:DUF5722 domain-containing protein n=1 Tax=Parapedobacter flavus TaxID=3110225 RepID=UPI002DB57494|nr:DUF5722 domain-containing protein [Parapedobacter sp. 10938]MEC3880731.1 DUF5722 domain-containing protein [Parapedobacter sp. 10938]
MMKRLLPLCLIGLLFVFGSSCKEKKVPQPPVVTPSEYLKFDLTSANDLDIQKDGSNQYQIVTTGSDPYLQLDPLKYTRGADKIVLTFEYQSSAKLNHIQVFLGPPVSEARSLKTGEVDASTGWETYSIDLGDEIEQFNWGSVGHFLRIDLGNSAGVEFAIKDIQFRVRNAEEEQRARELAEFRQNDQAWNKRIKAYLQKDYPDQVTLVDVTADKIRIEGTLSATRPLFLAEVTPYDELTEMSDFTQGVDVSGSAFSVEVARYVERDGFRYDRALSKWVVVDKDQGGQGVRSHARFPDKIQPTRSMPQQAMKGRKGLGGYAYNRGFAGDLDDLSISSVTVNIPVTSLMYLDARPNTSMHEYGGKKYYVSNAQVADLDRTLQTAASKDIVVAAIILVQPAAQSADPKVGELLQHPQFSGGDAFFTMPRMDQPESVNLYAAMLDFLADRYSRPDNQYGRIHKWIMHNEVDVGTVWTNMGLDRPMHVFLDAYYKSMRMCYTIARTYDAHAEVLGSFTHSWTEPAGGGDYATLDLLGGLSDYSRAEGDFQWGLACHPYPQDLNEPKTWNDTRATFSMGSPLVTFKNLEVLDAWIKKTDHKYQRSVKRTLWLSENGTNSRSYSEQDLLEQAAGFAYAWKKFKHLDGIDAIQWHNWIDNRGEFGLRIGLRRFPDDEHDPGGRKPVWYAYQAAGTDKEDEIFEPYKAIIGISSWDEVLKDLGL